jgi:RNA polymerase sigma-70 factor, ECF subfamily
LAETPGFDTIIDQFAERIFNHAYRMLGSREDAEEATQDVFLKIHQGLGDFRGESRISTWIWRITTNVCLSRRARKKISTDSLDEDTERSAEIEDKNVADPEELFIAQEAREKLAGLIADLNPQEASAITLFYLEGMDYAEIARILDVPMGSVATALHRGRLRLRMLYLRKEKVR